MDLNFFAKIFGNENEELPNLYPLAIQSEPFVEIDLQNIYSRILTDVLERTEGIKDEQIPLLWDNCVMSEAQLGLVSLVSKAMVRKEKLFLKYDASLKIIRKATQEEQGKIELAYKKGNTKEGVYINFSEYKKSDMLKIYSALEYCVISSLNKQMNLSKAIQFKISDLRAGVSLVDKQAAKTQATEIAKGLSKGKDVSMDAKDAIETAKPDLTAASEAMDFIAQKQSFYLGLPATWITGVAPKGLGDSGEGDQKAVERGLKNYYYAIVRPIVEALFDVKLSFKSQDFTGITTALEVLKTFELTSERYISEENKQLFINTQFGFPEDAVGDPVEEPAPTDPNAPPAPGAQVPPKEGQKNPPE